jgi:hypothetical protein
MSDRLCKECGQPIKPGRHKPGEYEHAQGCPARERIDPAQPIPQAALPTIQEMCGLVDDFTAGRTLKEFLEDMADE